MNFRQLEIYRAVMLSGSASRASELLSITQPAVSRSIAELEQSVGFGLFDRVRGRLVPTPEGTLFFSDVTASFVGLDTLRAAAARIRDFGSGSIRVASLAALGSTLVPRAIATFNRQHPEIAMTLQVRFSSAVRDLVASGQFDIGLAADEIDVSGVEHRAFQSSRALCAIPPGHPLASKTHITPADLHDQPFVALSPEDRARARLTKALDEVGARPRIIIETPYSTTVCALALSGVGLGIVNPGSIDGFPERGLVLRPFTPEIYFKTLLLFRPDAQRAQIVKDFTAALLAERQQQYKF
ncbi:LysR substrate-binding domain-containing protein [Sphingomonadaceae bacterium OTU29THOMA1]|nr:LysR substrate-binding domain-containing protein [Sphingomonadaceae bacterium OTU29THOMA1]